MKVLDRDFDDIFFSQFTAIVGGLVAGAIIATNRGNFFETPGLLVIIPGLLEVRGSIAGTFASRISSGLMLGVIKPTRVLTKMMKENFLATFMLSIAVSTVVGIMGFLFNLITIQEFSTNIILIAVSAGVMANLIEIPLTLLITLLIFRKGHDPNNIIGPFVTSTSDIISILAVLFAFQII